MVLRLLLLLAFAWIVPGASAGLPACEIGVNGCCLSDLDCDDGDACTGTESCTVLTGVCEAGIGVVCDDGLPCTADACDPATGLCSAPAVPDITPCDDGDACTNTDVCISGACVGGDPTFCDDLDPCTDDGCDPGTGGCVFTPTIDGTPCNDLNACTTTDACQSGVCVGQDPIVCDDANVCTDDNCVIATGTCSFVPTGDGTGCDDGDACTLSDSCQTGVCTPGTALVCDDATLCTDDRCEAGSCVFAPVDGRCDQGECFDGRCEPGTPGAGADGCTTTPARESESCTDDGAACTDDRCTAGLCVHVAENARCAPPDDGCSRVTCMPAAPDADADGCLPEPAGPDGTVCTEDLDPCTRDVCRAGTCTHEDVADPDACAPVGEPFRQALTLSAFTEAIEGAVEAVGLDDTRRLALLDILMKLRAGLDQVAEELNGADPDADTAQTRARAALVVVKPLPKLAKRFLRLIKSYRRRGGLPAPWADVLLRSAGDLRLGVRELKRDIRRLRRVLRTFVR